MTEVVAFVVYGILVYATKRALKPQNGQLTVREDKIFSWVWPLGVVFCLFIIGKSFYG